MFSTKGYFDLCVDEKAFAPNEYKKTLKTLYQFGYRTIAVNQTIEESGSSEPQKKNKKGQSRENADIVPTPFDVKQFEELKMEEFKIFNRLTITFSDQNQLHKITKSPLYKKYDIIAVNPTTTAAFQFCCNTFEADILTFNPEGKRDYRMNRKSYNRLVERGYFYELLYGAAIEDSTKRQNLIHTSHLYHAFGRSKNVIFSSGASFSFYIRNPYDVITLGPIFGLNEIQSKKSIAYYCQQLILSAVGRRHGKAVMFVSNEESKTNTDISTIVIESDSDEDMETDEPTSKKLKQ